MENRIRVFLCLYSCALGFEHPGVCRANGLAQRWQELIKILDAYTRKSRTLLDYQRKTL